MTYKNLLFALLLLTCFSSYPQFYEIVQYVNVEEHEGKNFTFEGKVFYKDQITNESWVVLGARFVNEESKLIKAPLYNSNAGDYYRKDSWSNYKLSGKINKKTKYLGVGVAVAGADSYYLDDFKLIINDRKDNIEIPLVNADFETDSLRMWQTYGLNDDTNLSVSKNKAFKGKQSLYINSSKVKVRPTLGNNPELGKYMDVNGVKLYYEVYGEGEPLLLLNGNNSSMALFNNQLEALNQKYMVIGLDSRGQGKSTSNDTRITYELMAEDVNTFLENLELKNVNILGWSDGGNIALILAMQHPDKVNKMAIMGSVLYNDNSSVNAETNKLIREQIKEMEDKAVDKNNMDYRLKVLLMTEPHINPDSLKKIIAPTLVMAGQHDVIKENHTKLIAKKIPNSKLVIFKGASHHAPEEISELFNETVLDFFSNEKL